MVCEKHERHHSFQNVNNINQSIKEYLIDMAKSSIHPSWYPNAKVYCDGQLILKVGSTKPSLNVDIWSGNHPFYTGSQKIIDTEGRVERFLRKYGLENET